MEMERRKPRVAAFAVALLVTLVALVMVPVWYSVLLSLKSYRPVAGLGGSPWTGFAAYRQVLQSPVMGSAVGNGLLLSVAGFVGSVLLGAALGWFVPRIREGVPRYIALGLLLLPTFVPNICWAVGVLPALAENINLSRWFFIAITAVSGAGLVGFFGAAFEMARPAGGFWQGIGWAALLSAFTCLTPDTELLRLMQSPLSYSTMETLDTYAYRIGLMSLELSTGAAAFILKLLLQGLLGAVVCAGVYWVFLRRHSAPLDTVVRETGEMPFVAWASAAAVLAVVGWVVLGGRLNLTGEAVSLTGIPAQLLSTALAFAMALPIAWAAITAMRTMRYGVFCAVAGLLLCALRPYAAEFLLLKQMGFVGTTLPTAAVALFTPKGLMLTLLCARLAGMPKLNGRPTWLLALMPACLAAATAWGDSLTPTTYILSAELYPSSLLLRQQTMTQPGVSAAGYLLTLLAPLLLCGACGAIAWRTMRQDTIL